MGSQAMINNTTLIQSHKKVSQVARPPFLKVFYQPPQFLGAPLNPSPQNVHQEVSTSILVKPLWHNTPLESLIVPLTAL